MAAVIRPSEEPYTAAPSPAGPAPTTTTSDSSGTVSGTGSPTRRASAFNIQLRSANPEGAAAFDELGFYPLIDAAHDGGTVEAFVREWLGTLLRSEERRVGKEGR